MVLGVLCLVYTVLSICVQTFRRSRLQTCLGALWLSFVWSIYHLSPSLEMVTLKSSSNSERPLGVVSGFSIWWNCFAISSSVVWR